MKIKVQIDIMGVKIQNPFDKDKLCVSVVKSSECPLVAVELRTISSDVASKGPEESTVSGEEVICG